MSNLQMYMCKLIQSVVNICPLYLSIKKRNLTIPPPTPKKPNSLPVPLNG